MILSNTEWRESQKLITEERIKILLQWVDTIPLLYSHCFFKNLAVLWENVKRSLDKERYYGKNHGRKDTGKQSWFSG